ncbi:MAG: LptF/LptG family permease [Bacteroidales bacterium]|nr:LptF/LptG family permease [Bacteroidales bacterium]
MESHHDTQYYPKTVKRLDFYILKKFIGTFFFAVALLMMIIIVFDLSENIDSFLKHDAPWQRVVVDHYLTSIPYFTNQFIHLFVFISVIFFTSKMANHSEVVAVLSSGVSFWRFLYPYVVGALLLTTMSLYFGNFLIPNMNEIRRKFKDEYIEHLVKGSGGNVHIQTAKDEYVYVSMYDLSRDLGYKFSIEKYDGIDLVYKMVAGIIYHEEGDHQWRVDNVTERYINGDQERIINHKRLDTVFENLAVSDFIKVKEDFEEMNFFELRDHINVMRQRGTEGIRHYEVEMHQRMAQPAAILILTLIGAALSSRRIKGGMGMHLGFGIAIAFSYVLLGQIGKALGINGVMSPVMAAWIPNFIYCVLAVYCLAKAPK